MSEQRTGLRYWFGRATGLAISVAFNAALFGPLALGVVKCTHENDYDAWDSRAVQAFAENAGNGYYWQYQQAVRVLEYAGEKIYGPK